jgi:DNA-binding NtrC family response regulator
LIDDDRNVNLALGIILRGAGHEVVSLLDGSKVLSHMQDIDLVITDVIMPNVDGIEVLNAMKKEHPSIPVIVISGGGRISADMYLSSAKAIGAKEVLHKPIDTDALIKVVDHVLSKAKA